MAGGKPEQIGAADTELDVSKLQRGEQAAAVAKVAAVTGVIGFPEANSGGDSRGREASTPCRL